MKKRTGERHTTYFNLTDALAEKGCALCLLAAKAAHDYLDAMLYENVNDIGTRKNMAASLGFCAPHAELARQMSDAFGVAILYEALCRDVITRIKNGETPRVGCCPVCRAAQDAEQRYVGEFCEHIGEIDSGKPSSHQTAFASTISRRSCERCAAAIPVRSFSHTR